MMHSLRVAVASKDGNSINEHFGHAKLFWIYEVDSEGCWFREKRNVDHYCHGHHGDQSALQKILKTISDCAVVFVAKIGEGPAEKLSARGISAVAEYTWEDIQESLLDYYNSNDFGSRECI